MRDLTWLLIAGGLSGLATTRLGWYDPGGFMRRMDWFGYYDWLEQSGIGGGVRRANYAISITLLLIGLLILVRS